jgi:hypothetical protein
VDRPIPERGTRASFRALTQSGPVEVVGYVIAVDAATVRVRDRNGTEHVISWPQISAWRSVGVARGRDPRRTPVSELDRLATEAGVAGRSFVIRLSQLLDGRSCDPAPAGTGVHLDREWAIIPDTAQLLPSAWWAAHHDARNLQVRTDDAARSAELLALGFTEIATKPSTPGSAPAEAPQR